MMPLRRRILFASLLFTLATFLALFRAALQNDQQVYLKTKTPQDLTLTKIKVFPRGGDEVPLKPPWPIPDLPIHTDANIFLTNNSTRFMVSNYSFAPGQGNIMFQYASLFALSKRYDATLLVPDDILLRRGFQLSATLISPAVQRKLLDAWPRIIFPDCCRYYNESEELAITRNTVMGYFQSWRYFHPHLKSQIRAEFEFLPPVQEKARAALQMALRATNRYATDVTWVGLHVRRGMDVKLNMRNIEHGHTVATKRYFNNAMDHFRQKYKNVIFVVCSDDPRWCEDNLKTDDVVVLKANQREVDMSVLQMCNHTIMSQGTFSWWAAYLKAEGETIYYSGWPRPKSRMDEMLTKEDYFFPDWISMA